MVGSNDNRKNVYDFVFSGSQLLESVSLITGFNNLNLVLLLLERFLLDNLEVALVSYKKLLYHTII